MKKTILMVLLLSVGVGLQAQTGRKLSELNAITVTNDSIMFFVTHPDSAGINSNKMYWVDIVKKVYGDSAKYSGAIFGDNARTFQLPPPASAHKLVLNDTGLFGPKLLLVNQSAGTPTVYVMSEDVTPVVDQSVGSYEFHHDHDGNGIGFVLGKMWGYPSRVAAGDFAGGFKLDILMDETNRNLLDVKGYNGANSTGLVEWNSAQLDVDFEWNTLNESSLYIRGSDGSVGIGTADPNTGGGERLEVVRATGGIIAAFAKASNTEAASIGDGSGMEIGFSGLNSAGLPNYYGSIVTEIVDNTDGVEFGRMLFKVESNGGLNLSLLLQPTYAQTIGGLSVGLFAVRPTTNDIAVIAIADNSGNNPVMNTTGNTAAVFAKNMGGTTEIFTIDEANNATQQTPHNSDGDWVFYSYNVLTGKTVYVNMIDFIRDMERLTGNQYIFEENFFTEREEMEAKNKAMRAE